MAESAWVYKRSDVQCHRYYAFRRHDDEQYLCLISLYVDLLRDKLFTSYHFRCSYPSTRYIYIYIYIIKLYILLTEHKKVMRLYIYKRNNNNNLFEFIFNIYHNDPMFSDTHLLAKRSSLNRIYSVCHYMYIFWSHHSVVK